MDTVLRGAGQVMFQDNPVTGLLFIVGIAWGANAAGMPAVAIGAVLGLIVSTVTAILLRVDQTVAGDGPVRLQRDPGRRGPHDVPAERAAAVGLHRRRRRRSSVVQLAVSNVMKTFGAPSLTFPFVLTTWFMLLGAYAFANVPVASMGPPAVPSPISPDAVTSLDPQALLETVAVGISQVFLIDNVITGIIFVVAIAVSSLWSAGFAVRAPRLALASALALGASTTSDVSAGLFGFSAVLTGIALGSVFYKPGLESWPSPSSGSSSRSSSRARSTWR